MFSALISKTTKGDDGIDLTLDIPDLPENINLFKWQIPTSENYEWLGYRNIVQDENFKQKYQTASNLNRLAGDQIVSGKDEGFYSTKTTPNVSLCSVKENDSSGEIWENILKLSISEFVDWDMKKEYIRKFFCN